MFKPGQLISLLEDVNYHIFLETLDNTRSIWTMGPPMTALSAGDTVMYVDSMEKTNAGSLDVKYIVLHDGKLWTTSGWFAKDKFPDIWKVKTIENLQFHVFKLYLALRADSDKGSTPGL